LPPSSFSFAPDSQVSMRVPPHDAWINPIGTFTVFCSSRAV